VSGSTEQPWRAAARSLHRQVDADQQPRPVDPRYERIVRLEALLREVEWGVTIKMAGFMPARFCHFCRGMEPDHAPDCRWAKEMGGGR